MIAPEVVAQVEARVATAADADWVEAHIRGLEPVTDGISLEIDGGFRRPPLERTPRNRVLWEQARRVAGEIDRDRRGARRRRVGRQPRERPRRYPRRPGAVGDGAHADHEHVIVERMPRARGAARSAARRRGPRLRPPRTVIGSVARGGDFAARPADPVPRPRSEWARPATTSSPRVPRRRRPGRAAGGRSSRDRPGDRLIGALGTRAATLTIVGGWRDAATTSSSRR
ncbi:MAG: hypothetical protein R2691_00615 [Solirubrobacterales bacterium]